jgi:hypothetical protein
VWLRTAPTDAGNESAATVTDRGLGSKCYVRACELGFGCRRGAAVMSDLPIHGNPPASIAVNAASDAKGVCRFDYRTLPVEKAQALQESRTRIHTEIKNTAESALAIGRELNVVKKKTLPHGAFQAWVESECGFSLRTAQNYMRAARLVSKNANFARLPLNTLYRMGVGEFRHGCSTRSMSGLPRAEK